MVSISLFLYFKPGADSAKEGEPATATHLRELGNGLRNHLLDVAYDIEKLLADGWECTWGLYDITCVHSALTSEEEAKMRLHRLGLNHLADRVELIDAECYEDNCDPGDCC